jgi:hypothetical protein
MASIHIKEKNYSEAAHCYLHIAALVAENLKHQGMYTLGSAVFKKITPNIELEEEINDNPDYSKNGENYVMNDLNEVKYTQVSRPTSYYVIQIQFFLMRSMISINTNIDAASRLLMQIGRYAQNGRKIRLFAQHIQVGRGYL